MKTLFTIMIVLASTSAWGQEIDCSTEVDDDLCVTCQVLVSEKRLQTVDCARLPVGMDTTLPAAQKFCGTLVGAASGYDRYYQYKGVLPTPQQRMSKLICEEAQPVDPADGLPGWYRFDKAAVGEQSATGDPIQMIAGQLAANAKTTEEAYVAARQAGKDEVAYECAVNDVLGLPCLQLVVFGPAVGASNLGWFTGLQLALHLPVKDWPYRSGVELGVVGGYSGDEDHGDHMVHRGQLGPFVQGVVMPWRRVGFLIGAQYDHRFPGEALDLENYLGGRFGVRFYLADWLALDLLGTAGGVRKDNDDWSGAGGGGAALQVNF